jgi:hypothetical protein
MTVDEIALTDLTTNPDLNFPWRPDMMKYQVAIKAAIALTCPRATVSQCMLAALIERESNFINGFQTGVPRGPGCGVGLTQITAGVNWSNPNDPMYAGLSLLDPHSNLVVCLQSFLIPAINAFPGDHQAAFDAYNLGARGVKLEQAAGESPDQNTTGGNYGRSVFQSWITYAAILQQATVDWSSWVPE